MDNYASTRETRKPDRRLIWLILGSTLTFLLSFLLLETEIGRTLSSLSETVISPIRGSGDALKFFVLISELGEPLAVIPILIIVGGLLLQSRKFAGLGRIIISGVLMYILVTVFKDIFGVARPEHALFSEDSGRFPSGHAAIGAFFVLVGWELGRCYRLQHSRFIVGVLALFAMLMAISRLVLNVHKPLDLLAGIAVSIFAYAVSVLIVRKIGGRKGNL